MGDPRDEFSEFYTGDSGVRKSTTEEAQLVVAAHDNDPNAHRGILSGKVDRASITELPAHFTDEDVRTKVNELIRKFAPAVAALALFAGSALGAGLSVQTKNKGAIYNDEPVVVGVEMDSSDLVTTNDLSSATNAVLADAKAYTDAHCWGGVDTNAVKNIVASSSVTNGGAVAYVDGATNGLAALDNLYSSYSDYNLYREGDVIWHGNSVWHCIVYGGFDEPHPFDRSEWKLIGDDDDVAIGKGANVWLSSTVVGNSATAEGYSAAFGRNATAHSYSSAFGYGAIADSNRSSAFGSDAHAYADSATAIGAQAIATKTNTVAVGQGADVRYGLGTAVGSKAKVSAEGGTALGEGARADGGSGQSTAVGQGANAHGSSSTAVGQGTFAEGLSTAIGQGAYAGATGNTAVGRGAKATSLPASSVISSVALGADSLVTNRCSVAIGAQSRSHGDYTVTLGSDGSEDTHATTPDDIYIGGTSLTEVIVRNSVSLSEVTNVVASSSVTNLGAVEYVDGATNGLLRVEADPYLIDYTNSAHVALGRNAKAGHSPGDMAQHCSVAIGDGATISSSVINGGIAIGAGAHVVGGGYGIAIGNDVTASGAEIRIGYPKFGLLDQFEKFYVGKTNVKDYIDSTESKSFSVWTNGTSIAVGSGALAQGGYSVAIGSESVARGEGSAAICAGVAEGDWSFAALGGAHAPGAIALGGEACESNSVVISYTNDGDAGALSHGVRTITLGDAQMSSEKLYIGNTNLADIIEHDSREVFEANADYALTTLTDAAFSLRSGEIGNYTTATNIMLALDFSAAGDRSGDCLLYISNTGAAPVEVALAPDSNTYVSADLADAKTLKAATTNLISFIRVAPSTVMVSKTEVK